MTMTEQMGFLSNYWWAVVASDYSVTIGLAITGLLMLLQIWAVIKPGVTTNSIIGLIRGWVYGFPGMTKETHTTSTVASSESTTEKTESKTEIKPDGAADSELLNKS